MDKIRINKYYEVTNYDLKINTNFKDFTFSIEEEIYLKLNPKQSTLKNNEIIFHSVNLNIDLGSVKILEIENKKPIEDIQLIKIDKDEKLETVTFVFDNPIFENFKEIILKFNFRSKLSQNMKGYYYSNYKDTTTNEKKFIFTTQFESIEARSAFVCLDEPVHQKIKKLIIIKLKN
jgi:aminopeptidase N